MKHGYFQLGRVVSVLVVVDLVVVVVAVVIVIVVDGVGVVVDIVDVVLMIVAVASGMNNKSLFGTPCIYHYFLFVLL